MNRFHGKVGFAGDTVESPSGSGVYVDQIVEFSYFGDVQRDRRAMKPGEGLNDNIVVQIAISIVADKHAREHYFNIRYVQWEGVLWTVTAVEVRSPRLVLTLGEVYNGPTP